MEQTFVHGHRRFITVIIYPQPRPRRCSTCAPRSLPNIYKRIVGADSRARGEILAERVFANLGRGRYTIVRAGGSLGEGAAAAVAPAGYVRHQLHVSCPLSLPSCRMCRGNIRTTSNHLCGDILNRIGLSLSEKKILLGVDTWLLARRGRSSSCGEGKRGFVAMVTPCTSRVARTPFAKQFLPSAGTQGL
jgi:hypothetical protein